MPWPKVEFINISKERVHFHEVGALDSIADIVGAAICLDYLKVDKVMSSPIQLGGGMVKCAHGIMPVPAPATTLIVQNVPVKTGLVQHEATTPTGAAILVATVDEFTDQIDFPIKKDCLWNRATRCFGGSQCAAGLPFGKQRISRFDPA